LEKAILKNYPPFRKTSKPSWMIPQHSFIPSWHTFLRKSKNYALLWIKPTKKKIFPCTKD
jgi:hypothetical protein